MANGKTLELVIFELNDGVDVEEFLAHSEPVPEWVRKQPGFVSRNPLKSAEDDKWIDAVWWESPESAAAAAELTMTSETCAPMFASINMETAQIIHGSTA